MAETSTTPKRCAASALPIAALAASSSRPRAVVSGGAGFIGSHLCRALLDQGMRVLAIDNFITGSPQNLKALESNSDFEFRQADVNHGVFIGGGGRHGRPFPPPAPPPPNDPNPLHTPKGGPLGGADTHGLAPAEGAACVLASTSRGVGDRLA